MNVSLDSYVDHTAFNPGPKLFRHFVEQVGSLTGSIYGRTMYEIMRYWDEDSPTWGPDERDFAAVWRRQPKWVVSRTLTSVGPNATLVSKDFETVIRKLKSDLDGDVEIAGTRLAKSVGDLGLIDQYGLYLHPVVLGSGTPFFAGPRPRLRLVGSQRMEEDVVHLTYAPADAASA
jgi:dihydrofolate reductase